MVARTERTKPIEQKGSPEWAEARSLCVPADTFRYCAVVAAGEKRYEVFGPSPAAVATVAAALLGPQAKLLRIVRRFTELGG